ncbi:MAG: TonB-dependent receptor plug domain-containing protein [Ferruginibacter sp.]|nr:TonB-dependent receptor plug domain-containing protein [Ferruginibacter sp.]
MKLFICALFCANTLVCVGQGVKKFNDTTYLQPIEVTAIRANEKAPFAKTDLSKKEIAKNNLGQDLPFLLNQTPSAVINADAGNGVGYTGIRIRGTDATRINVTLNGIPYNDAESQGAFFVDLPDISSSANSIQIQRGVGTSSNGAGAFGATINLATNEIDDSMYTEFNNSYGSYNTIKNTIRFGSGIIGKHFTIEGRLSRINSNGYIDRAASRLQSFYFSTAWLNKKTSLRLNIFSGKEKTYQAWNGIPEAKLKGDDAGLLAHYQNNLGSVYITRADSVNLFTAGNRTYNLALYNNETDNYTQTHYQLFYNHQFSAYWKANAAVFLTKGAGYYEQYKTGENLSAYGLPDYNDGGNIITQTDLVRQLWLDNNFYGTIFSIQHKKKNTELIIGGGWNKYDGKHFGEITRAKIQPAIPLNFRWYNLNASKQDISIYSKWTEQLGNHWQSFIDVQFRNVQYHINGFADNPTLKIDKRYSFLNPKIGLTYTTKNWQAYGSYALAAKEPNRGDFEAGQTSQPKTEKLNDFELGIERKSNNYSLGANIYFMKYNNQLVLVGNINDVGAYTRTNIPKSYRLGIELQGKTKIAKWINWAANISLSENRIKNYTDLVDDFDNGGTKAFYYKKTAIAFSPSLVAGSALNFIPVKNVEISFLSKYVGRQYLDNTAQKSRSLKAYFVQDIRLAYALECKFIKETSLVVQLNNVFNKKYEANGYTYSYIYGKLITENFYFPMATFNCMIGLNVRL